MPNINPHLRAAGQGSAAGEGAIHGKLQLKQLPKFCLCNPSNYAPATSQLVLAIQLNTLAENFDVRCATLEMPGTLPA